MSLVFCVKDPVYNIFLDLYPSSPCFLLPRTEHSGVRPAAAKIRPRAPRRRWGGDLKVCTTLGAPAGGRSSTRATTRSSGHARRCASRAPKVRHAAAGPHVAGGGGRGGASAALRDKGRCCSAQPRQWYARAYVRGSCGWRGGENRWGS